MYALVLTGRPCFNRPSCLGVNFDYCFHLYGVIMERHLYTIRWTQPYATDYLRPYLRQLQEQLESLIEHKLDDGDYSEANEIINRIRQL